MIDEGAGLGASLSALGPHALRDLADVPTWTRQANWLGTYRIFVLEPTTEKVTPASGYRCLLICQGCSVRAECLDTHSPIGEPNHWAGGRFRAGNCAGHSYAVPRKEIRPPHRSEGGSHPSSLTIAS